jgi:hypothetical protein
MKDRERIEICRLQERTGGYHKYVDSASVHNPDPISTHFVSGKKLQLKKTKTYFQKARDSIRTFLLLTRKSEQHNMESSRPSLLI